MLRPVNTIDCGDMRTETMARDNLGERSLQTRYRSASVRLQPVEPLPLT